MSRVVGAEHARHLGQHLVALRVAVGVVDPLEVVDVEHHEGERAVEATASLELAREDRGERTERLRRGR